MLWSPTIKAALLAGTPWLDVFCPGCGTSRAIDLRTVDRHPLASVGTLVLGPRCSWCPGLAPMPSCSGSTPYRRQLAKRILDDRARSRGRPPDLRGNRISQKKDKSGKGKATDQD
jgi:hypothetical protein